MNESGIPKGYVKLGPDWYVHQSYVERLRAANPQPVEGKPLVSPVPREETGLRRARIVFTVYAVRPADWDGYHIKELQDMVVHAGILRDDDFQTVIEGTVRSRKAASKSDERTEIEVIEV